MQQAVFQIVQCPSRDLPVHLYHLGDSGTVPPLSTQHEPFLIVAQWLLTPLQLPPVKERKFDHTHDIA
jgi:hypothetical protein